MNRARRAAGRAGPQGASSRRAPLIFGLVLASVLSACAPDDGEKQPRAVQRQSESTDNGAADAGSAQLPKSPALPATSAAAVPTPPVESPETVGSRAPRDAGELLDALQSLAWTDDEAVGGQAASLLRQLRARGVGAIDPIRDFLLEAKDGDPALRLALVDALLSLGLPEVEDAALELLASGAPPAELWRLGKYLEEIRPGTYADSILQAAEQSLIDAGPATFVPVEFFQLLAALGTDETALLLAELQTDRGAYASMALASMPEGRGLALLEQDARTFEAGQDTLVGRLAIQLLAEQAPQYPQAAAALIELAERGAIPPDLWPFVLDLVAGNWVLSMEPPRGGSVVGSHTYYRPEGNQVIYRVAPPPGVDVGLQSERLYLLDRLQTLAPPELGLRGGE